MASSLLSLFSYSEVGKRLQKIAEILRNIHSVSVLKGLLLVVERNLIRADCDHLLGNQF